MVKLLKFYITVLCVALLCIGCVKKEEAPEQENVVTEETSTENEEEEAFDLEKEKEYFPIIKAGIDYLSAEGIPLEPKTQIAMIVSDKSNKFYSTIKEGANQAIADLNEVLGYTGKQRISLLYDGPKQENVIDQINIIDQFLDKAPHALTISFADATASKTQMQMMKNNGIQVIAFDAPDDSQMAEALVSTDNKAAAAEAAGKLFEALDENSKVAVIVHNSMKQTGKDRYSAITGEYLSKYLEKKLRFVDIIYMDRTDKSNKKVMDELLEKNPDLAGIICTDLKTTEMVINYAKDLESQEFSIVGFDSSEKILNAIKDGTVLGTVAQDAHGMGYATVIAAARSIADMANATNIHSGYLWIDASNINSEEAKVILNQ